MVVHLLVLGRVVSHERSACEHQVGTGKVKALVYQEVLLFPAQVAANLLHFGVKILGHGGGSGVNGLQRTQQRRLIVERFARVRNEDGGDAKRVVDDEHGRSGVPSRISASLEGVADAAVGERRRVGFLLNEQLSRKLFNHSTLAVGFHKGIVFFCRALC